MRKRIAAVEVFTSSRELVKSINKNNIVQDDIIDIVYNEGVFYLFYYKDENI